MTRHTRTSHHKDGSDGKGVMSINIMAVATSDALSSQHQHQHQRALTLWCVSICGPHAGSRVGPIVGPPPHSLALAKSQKRQAGLERESRASYSRGRRFINSPAILGEWDPQVVMGDYLGVKVHPGASNHDRGRGSWAGSLRAHEGVRGRTSSNPARGSANVSPEKGMLLNRRKCP